VVGLDGEHAYKGAAQPAAETHAGWGAYCGAVGIGD
jgi:hypothetical protein